MTISISLSTAFLTKNRGWKTIVQNHARQILNNSLLNTPILGDDEWFLRTLIDHHPDSSQKIGVGVARFEVRENREFRGRTFWLVRLDGSETDFSYIKCLRGEGGSHLIEFKEACRRAVAEDVIDFKKRLFESIDPVFCPISGGKLTWDTAHIDHAPPNTFDVIANEFAKTRTSIVDDLLPPIDGGIGRCFKKQETAAEFRRFHWERASLRAVTIEANLSTLRRKV